MDAIGTIVSWLQDAWNALSRLPLDQGLWGIVFGVLLLAYLVSIARSVRRLNRRLSSAITELEEIRSALKGIERTLDRSRAKTSPADGENRKIWDLPVREGKEKP